MRESPHSRHPPRQNVWTTPYTEREQWTDLSVPKSTRWARPGKERTPLALTYTTLATVVFKIESRMPPFKTIYEPISDTCPLPPSLRSSSLFLPELLQVDPFDLNKFHGNDIFPLALRPRSVLANAQRRVVRRAGCESVRRDERRIPTDHAVEARTLPLPLRMGKDVFGTQWHIFRP